MLRLKGYLQDVVGQDAVTVRNGNIFWREKLLSSVCWYLLVTCCAQSSVCQFSACLPIMSAFLSLDSSPRFVFISPTGSRLVRACPLNNSTPSASLKVSHLSKNCLLSTKHSLPEHLKDGCKNTAVFTCLSSLNSL